MNGARNLLNMLEAEGEDRFLGKGLSQWRKVLKQKKSGVDFYIPENSEVRERLQGLEGAGRIWFRVLLFSGMRFRQSFIGVERWKDVVVKEGFLRISLEGISEGTKRGYWLYLPAEMWDEVKSLDFSVRYKRIYSSFPWGRIGAKVIRKWHYDFMLAQEVPEGVADFIQGRSAKTIGFRHYADKLRHADGWYAKLLGKFPEWLTNTEGEPVSGSPL